MGNPAVAYRSDLEDSVLRESSCYEDRSISHGEGTNISKFIPIYSRFKHYINPLHVCCRTLDFLRFLREGVGIKFFTPERNKNIGLYLSKNYEKYLYNYFFKKHISQNP
ncbi:MAG: hypothetical protein ABH811_02205 [archaeon]